MRPWPSSSSSSSSSSRIPRIQQAEDKCDSGSSAETSAIVRVRQHSDAGLHHAIRQNRRPPGPTDGRNTSSEDADSRKMHAMDGKKGQAGPALDPKRCWRRDWGFWRPSGPLPAAAAAAAVQQAAPPRFRPLRHPFTAHPALPHPPNSSCIRPPLHHFPTTPSRPLRPIEQDSSRLLFRNRPLSRLPSSLPQQHSRPRFAVLLYSSAAMSQLYYPQSSMPHHNFNSHQSHNHHGGRSRRGQRFGQQQHNPNKLLKHPRPARDNAEALQAASVRKDFEAARSFDLEDDEVFCPWHLLTEDDLQSIHSSSSDRSSSSAGSPETSPLQHQLQPTPSFSLSQPQMPSNPYHQGGSNHLKIHAPLAQRSRNAIPIVDPNSRHASPPTSISPGRQAQKAYNVSRRW